MKDVVRRQATGYKVGAIAATAGTVIEPALLVVQFLFIIYKRKRKSEVKTLLLNYNEITRTDQMELGNQFRGFSLG